MQKQVDIVIPVHNRPEHTTQTLLSLLNFTDPKLFNLYVVNDYSDEETRKAITTIWKNSEENTVFNIIDTGGPIGPAASRNRVCKTLTEFDKRSKYLYHSDNDVFFHQGWLERLISVFEHIKSQKYFGSNIKLLGGGCHPYLQDKNSFFIGQLDVTVGIKDAVSGYSQLMEWETWDKYGPFEEGQGSQEKKIMGSEDWAFCQRIIADGGLVASIRPEVVIHTGKTNTYGDPSTGAETFQNHEGIIIK